MALVSAFLSAKNENRQLEDLPLADFGRLPERHLVSVRIKSINEKFLNWKLRPLLFFNHDSTRFSILRVSAKALYDCRFIYFHSLMKSAFPLSRGPLGLYDKQNNTRLLVDMKFAFSCSLRHLTRELWSLYSGRNSLSTRAHVLFSFYWLAAWPHRHALKWGAKTGNFFGGRKPEVCFYVSNLYLNELTSFVAFWRKLARIFVRY